ncbi:CPBP family intramembrane metalloprotease [bacterium]|nr:CPBP family intramembrane metalloprotease [bacterium]
MPFNRNHIFNLSVSAAIIPFLLFLAIFCFPVSTHAISKLGCFGAAAAEYAVPGLGYAITRQWDKAIVFGGTRWVALSHYYESSQSEYYQEEADDIYEEIDADDSESGNPVTRVSLTKETWNAQYWGNLYGNVLFMSWGDFYENGCQSNTETYSYLLSPFRIDHFYKKWQFWLPVVLVMGNYAYNDDETEVEYYLYRGLKESDLRRDSFSEYYMVGVGEEMFFRGVVQHFFFDLLKDNWQLSPGASRHLSILGASTVFALAHSGAGFTASPATAFLFGLYEGYVYHPSLDEFDLMTAIAIHAWWDILVTYTILNSAKFHEEEEIEVPIMKIGFRF